MTDLKDSGARKEFKTGAVRDIHDGKGRFDLIPGAAICFIMNNTEHKPLDTDGMTALALHFESGSVKYSARNWEKGMDTHAFIDSGMRHLYKWVAGHQDEPHAHAFLWNGVCFIDTKLRIERSQLPKELDTFKPAFSGFNFDSSEIKKWSNTNTLEGVVQDMHAFMCSDDWRFLVSALRSAFVLVGEEIRAQRILCKDEVALGVLSPDQTAVKHVFDESGNHTVESIDPKPIAPVHPGNVVTITSGLYAKKYADVRWRVRDIDSSGLCRLMNMDDGGCVDIGCSNLSVVDASANEFKPIHKLFPGAVVFIANDHTDRWRVERVGMDDKVAIRCVTDKPKGLRIYDVKDLDLSFDQSQILDRHLEKVKNEQKPKPEIGPRRGDRVVIARGPLVDLYRDCDLVVECSFPESDFTMLKWGDGPMINVKTADIDPAPEAEKPRPLFRKGEMVQILLADGTWSQRPWTITSRNGDDYCLKHKRAACVVVGSRLRRHQK